MPWVTAYLGTLTLTHGFQPWATSGVQLAAINEPSFPRLAVTDPTVRKDFRKLQ